MKIKSQMAMVLNLDKCLGCHTCSIPCKHVWTNRRGAEYMWFNDVETKPGVGYPRRWEDQKLYRGGWISNGKGPAVRAAGRAGKLVNIFHNPDLPGIDDYYEPWTYDYEKLVESPSRKHQPTARQKSQLTGEHMKAEWGPNWEDDLAGAGTTAVDDVNFEGIDAKALLSFERVFMFYLPRLCEHCLNPACVASCPAGALYKRDEDGIVLVDQESCRGWRYCVSGCPYKKVYFNWHAGRSEKCLFCYPRIEAGMTTLCSHTCVGRIRYVGVILYDADRIKDAAATLDDKEVYQAQLDILLDPHDPKVIAEARDQGIAENFIEAAQRSPIFKLAVEWGLALPPHPEFRTLPMVWYVPPLSPMLSSSAEPEEEFHSIDESRIPVKYLANLLCGGNEQPVRLALKRLMALRQYSRSLRLGNKPDTKALEDLGLSSAKAEDMYRLLAIAKSHDRFVIPTVRREDTDDLHSLQGSSGLPERG